MNEPKRIDLHSHSIFSDGVLLPSEMMQRVAMLGYAALGITDHADASNYGTIIEGLLRVAAEQAHDWDAELIVGVELTHVAPGSIAKLARMAKAAGAEIVVVHGETIVEPVAPGTNRAAVDCPEVDILAHPGFLTLEEAGAAASRGCLIEVTTRKGHSLTNGHVVAVCRQVGALMTVNSDTHTPSDMAPISFAQAVARGAGMNDIEVFAATVSNPQRVVADVLRGRHSIHA